MTPSPSVVVLSGDTMFSVFLFNDPPVLTTPGPKGSDGPTYKDRRSQAIHYTFRRTALKSWHGKGFPIPNKDLLPMSDKFACRTFFLSTLKNIYQLPKHVTPTDMRCSTHNMLGFLWYENLGFGKSVWPKYGSWHKMDQCLNCFHVTEFVTILGVVLWCYDGTR